MPAFLLEVRSLKNPSGPRRDEHGHSGRCTGKLLGLGHDGLSGFAQDVVIVARFEHRVDHLFIATMAMTE